MFIIVEINNNQIINAPILELDLQTAQEIFSDTVADYGVEVTGDVFEDSGEAVIHLEDATIQLIEIEDALSLRSFL
jgi:hypothetical protein